MVRFGAGLLGIAMVLACGGVGGGGSDAAQSLCDHLSQEYESDCTAYGAGSTVTIDGIEVTIDKVTAWEGSSDTKLIQNYDERNRMKKVDHQALALEATFTSTKPVKSNVDFVVYLFDGDGERRFVQPYNTKVYTGDRKGWIDLWNDDKLGPGKSRQIALVYPAASIEGSKAVLRLMEKRPDPKDPRGRMKTFTNELYVLDLGPPT